MVRPTLSVVAALSVVSAQGRAAQGVPASGASVIDRGTAADHETVLDQTAFDLDGALDQAALDQTASDLEWAFDDVVPDVQHSIDPVPSSKRVSADRMVIQTNDDALLAPLIGNSEWTVRAVCAGTDPDALFVTGAAQREAARLCQGCPVRLECLADALDNRIEYGVWGGMTERQRRAVLKKSPDVVSWRSMLEEMRASSTEEAAS